MWNGKPRQWSADKFRLAGFVLFLLVLRTFRFTMLRSPFVDNTRGHLAGPASTTASFVKVVF
jgi:hypothetical protein